MFGKGRKGSMGHLAALQPLIGQHANLEQAASLGEMYKEAPLARVIGTGLSEFQTGLYQLGAAASEHDRDGAAAPRRRAQHGARPQA